MNDRTVFTEEQLRSELQVAFDQATRGEWVEWDPDKIKQEGRRRLAEQLHSKQ